MSRPFFSVVIPTYNRAADLKIAINSILKQDFDDYEIIVSDNASTDNTETICQNFKDKRIKYSKNKKNLGFSHNLYKAIKKASGKYIFMLGDDDFILNKNTFFKIYHQIRKYNYGIVRLKFIYHDDKKNLFSKYFKNIHSTILNKNQDNITILRFLVYDVISSFMSGLVFKNTKNIRINKLENNKNKNVEISDFWISYIYPAVKSYGGYIDLKNPIIANFAVTQNPTFLYIKNGKLLDEEIWNLYFEYLNDKEKNIWKTSEIDRLITLLPSVKYYTTNKNLFLWIKRMLELNNKLYLNWLFYFCAIIAFFMPRFVWKLFRNVYHHSQAVTNQTVRNNYLRIINKKIN